MDLKLKRRAVYTGLRPFLSDIELMSSMALWQQRYAQKSEYAFAEFLEACCNTEALRPKRAKILSALMRAMRTKEESLLEDPYDEKTGEFLIVKKKPTFITTETAVVFAYFFMQLIQQCDATVSRKVRMYAIERLPYLHLDVLSRKYMTDWLIGQSDTLTGTYQLTVLRKVINECYVAMCQYVGPVKADQMLARAITKAEPFAAENNQTLHDLL